MKIGMLTSSNGNVNGNVRVASFPHWRIRGKFNCFTVHTLGYVLG